MTPVVAFVATMLMQSVPACAPQAGLPLVKNFAPGDNLQFWSIVQDQRGVLYMGRREGVHEFDGVSWRDIPTDNMTTVRSLAMDSTGTIYVGAQGSFGYLAPATDGALEYRALSPELVSAADEGFGDVWKTYVGRDGVYFQTNTHIFRLSEGDVTVWRPETTFHFSYWVHGALHILERGVGLKRLQGDQLMMVPGGELLAPNRLYGMYPLDDERAVLATREAGLFLMGPSGVEPFPTVADDFLRRAHPYSGTVLDDGRLAIGTSMGLLVLDAETDCATLVNHETGLESETVRAVYQDPDGAVWLGTEAGYSRVDIRSPVTAFDRSLGIEGSVTSSVSFEGQHYVGTSLGILKRAAPDNPLGTARYEFAGGPRTLVFDLLEVGGRLLAATNEGVHELRSGAWTRVNSRVATDLSALPGDSIVLEVGVPDLALLRRSESRWADAGVISGAPAGIQTAALLDDGRGWAVTRAGAVWRIEPGDSGGLVSFHPVEGALPTGTLVTNRVGDRIVFATDNGLFRPTADGLGVVPDSSFGAEFAGGSSDWVTRLARGPDGNTWILAGGDSGPVAVVTEDGAPAPHDPWGKDVPQKTLYSVTVDDEGIVWLGGVGALYRFDPTGGPDPSVEPRATLVRTVRVGSDSLVHRGAPGQAAASGALPYVHNALRFTYALPEFAGQDDVTYQSLLDGFDATWSEWTSETLRDYTNLPEGEYTFRVRGRDGLGRVAPEGTFGFSLLPPWYRTLPAYGLYLALFGLATWAVVRAATARQRHTENRLQALVEERTKALHASEVTYKDLFDTSSDLILVFDEGGRIHEANGASEDVLGSGPGGLLDRSIFDFVSDDQRRRVADILGGRQEMPTRLELTLRSASGSERSVDASFQRLPSRNGGGLIQSIARDISERRRREALEAKVRQAQRLESLSVLAGGVAHDFNNLLMGILGNADLALLDLPATSPVRPQLEGIEAASHRAADLCRQMLAYSGRGHFVVTVFDMRSVVEEMMHILEVTISRKADIHYDLSDDALTVTGDATQIRQIVMNLVTNAAESMGESGGVIRVGVGSMYCDRACLEKAYVDEDLTEGMYTFLEVTDTGQGMDRATREQVFDPFFTTKFTGRGLGMAAVLGIVRGHEGAIIVDSEPDRGTTIRVLIPAEETLLPAEPLRAEQDDWQGTGCVLLVDDEEAVRRVGRSMLERLGFAVLVAEDGLHAIEVFRKHQGEICCVVLDLTMPRMDGQACFAELRRLSPDLKILLASGYDETDVTRRFQGEDLSGFISKPFRVNDLRTSLKAVLGD